MKLKCFKYILFMGSVLMSCTKEIPNNNDDSPKDADLFYKPSPIANPKNDDEYFFNYRLAEFAPSTEPLINETFGTVPRFEEVGFWEHTSYTSHVVGFTTNLPTISIIEYGETAAYGHTTAQTESYFYQHLHYIKGLEPGKTYHYRFVAQDYDGVTISSSDHTFTVNQLTDDIIRIPDDMVGDAPYTLTQSNARYVLTQDLTVPTMAINIKAHNVELDLDGHTIIYDNVPSTVAGSGVYDEEATFGIRSGLWNFTNFKIFNGIIKQGVNGGAGVYGEGYNPLFLHHMGNTYNEVAGITVDYYGNNIGGMVTSNGHIHHNLVYDRGTAIDDRHAGIRAIKVGDGINNDVSFNSLRRFRNWGIGATGGKLEYNELYSDSFATNSFALGAGNNLTVKNNKIFGMGYNPLGIGWGSDLYVKDNFIYLRGFSPSMRFEEFGRKSAIAGMRITDGNVKNVLYEDNVIVLKPEDGCVGARGIWGFNGINNTNIVYRRNTIKVEAMPGNCNNPEDGARVGGDNIAPYYNNEVNYAIAAVTFSERAENTGDPIPDPVIFEDNHLIGNVNLVVVGEGYGICHSVWMYGTKLEKIEHDSEFFHPVRIGFWYWDTRNNRMVDNKLVNISEEDMTPFFFGGTGKMEISYGESKTVIIKGNNGTPLSNKSITLTTPEDGYTQTIKTDASGRLSFDLLTVRYYKFGNSQEHNGEKGERKRIDYSEYTFSCDGYQPLTVPIEQLKSANELTM
ncbi:MAG: hypothetical protein LBP63_09145 [Prevotellaceae bacterium]|jgi:hypothetical protein|nr:hypothetical protein [Prevotellaceae bacterium]